MQILKNNNGIKKTCAHCNSLLLITYGDVRFCEDFHHSPFYCICAACGQSIYLSTDELPAGWAASIADEGEY